jgi:hypothetical protein
VIVAETLGIELPKLPKLNREDIKAVRSFLPGKLLSRTAALLSLLVPPLTAAGVVDQVLQRVLNVDLLSTPRFQHYGLLFGLPLLAVASQLVIEFRAKRSRRSVTRIASRSRPAIRGKFFS